MFGLRRLMIIGAIAVLLPTLAAAQAMVEYGLAVGRSGVAGAGAGRSVGKSTGAVFEKAGQALSNAAQAGQGNSKYPIASPSDPRPAPRPAAPPALPELATNPVVDPAEVKEGLERHELLDKFGRPSMKLTMMDGGDVVERLFYRSPGRDSVVVIVRNGKVASAQAIAN